MYTSLIRSNDSTPRRAHNALVGVLAMAIVVLPALAMAQQQQKTLPINIEANQADYAQTNGVSTYTGDVRMIRGGLTLTGNRLVVTRVNDRDRIKAVLTGNPAHINKKPDSDSAERITGHASRIEYTNNNAQVVLRGKAVVNRGGDEIRGEVITHDLDNDSTTAKRGSGDNDRVRVTIQPDDGPS